MVTRVKTMIQRVIARVLRLRYVAELEDVTTDADTWRQMRFMGRRWWEVWGVRVPIGGKR